MKYYRNYFTWEDIQKAAVLNKSLLGNLHKEEKRKVVCVRETMWSGMQVKKKKEVSSVKKTNDSGTYAK